MKKRLQMSIAALAMVGFMFSCSTSNDVTSNRNIQKRKYNKGFFIDFGKKGGVGSVKHDEIVLTDVVTEEDVVVVESIQPNDAAMAEEKAVVVNPVNEAVVEENIVETENGSIAANDSKITIDKFDASEVKSEDVKQIRSNFKTEKTKLRKAKKTVAASEKSSDDAILYYVLAFFIPFLAVGLVTDWDVKQVIINILLTMLCGIPGIIHAFIVVSRNV